MSRVRNSALLLSLIGLAGCTAWPPAGQGGIAELRPPSSRPADGAAAYDRLDGLTRELASLRARNADRLYPASVQNADRLVVRIKRQLAGGLVEDAELDLGLLQQSLERLSQQPRSASGEESRA